MLIKLFEKYFDLSGVHNAAVRKALKGIETVEDGLAILEKHGWFITGPTVSKIKADGENFTEEDVEEIKELQEQEEELIETTNEEYAEIKDEIETSQEKARRSGE